MLNSDLSRPVPIDSDALPMLLAKCAWKVAAGFPSPAADHAEERIDINTYVIRNKEASFLFGVKSDSMNGIGIYPGDTLVVDRSIEAKHNDIVLAVLDSNFTVKRFYKRGGVVKLLAENNLYPPIVVKDGQELTVWGVVTYNLHKLY